MIPAADGTWYIRTCGAGAELQKEPPVLLRVELLDLVLI